MKKWIWISGFVIVLFVGLAILSPFYSVYQIKKSVSGQDTETLSKYVAFSELRGNLKGQLNEVLENKFGKRSVEVENRFSNLTFNFAKKFANRMVDSYITPDGLATLMGGNSKKENKNTETIDPNSEKEVESNPETTKKPMFKMPSEEKIKLLKNARFSYQSTSEFIISMPTKNNKTIRFILTRNGMIWKLNNIILPLGAAPK